MPSPTPSDTDADTDADTNPTATYDDLSTRQRELVDLLPADSDELADALGISPSGVRKIIQRVTDKGYPILTAGYGREWLDGGQRQHTRSPTPDRSTSARLVHGEGDVGPAPGAGEVFETITGDDGTGDDADAVMDTDPDLAALDAVDPAPEAADEGPTPADLTDRERYIATSLQTGASLDELVADLNERPSVVAQHLRDLKHNGWPVYYDGDADHYAIDGDHALRSSEHKATRTRKANRWWELRHNDLVREFRTLETPRADLAYTPTGEDWITHMTDLHAGDFVREEDGEIVYSTQHIPSIVDYITRRSLALANGRNATYDTAHLLWGGDFITNEGIYEGQFEDLDAWLDEQHDCLIDPLVAQLKAFAQAFDTVQVVCLIGNHGDHRASGTSGQANADLVLFKTVRNTVAQIRKHGGYEFDNVEFVLGEARPYRNFTLRDGRLRGHLRHGQHRQPQAHTSAQQNKWRGTLLDHEFDLCFMGHHHISGMLPWDGPPIIATASPKPGGDFIDQIKGRTPTRYQPVATALGVSDDGLTSVMPIDTRHYEPPTVEAPASGPLVSY